MERVQKRYFEETSHRLFEIEAPTQNGSAFVNAFGGHSQACGFSFHHDHYDAFERLLRDEMTKLPDEQFYFHYDIVDTLTVSKLSNDFIKQLDKLMPFGQRFEYPLFKITNCKLGNKIRPFGNKFQPARTPHVEFAVTDGKPSGKYAKNPRYITCVGFGLYDHFHDVIREDKDALFDVVASVDFRRGRDRKLTHFQLTVVDIRQSV